MKPAAAMRDEMFCNVGLDLIPDIQGQAESRGGVSQTAHRLAATVPISHSIPGLPNDEPKKPRLSSGCE